MLYQTTYYKGIVYQTTYYKGIVLNWALPSLHGGSLTCYSPLNLYTCYSPLNLYTCYSPLNLYINLSCLSGCLFVSNKRQNGWTDRAQIFCGISRYPRESLWMMKIKNNCVEKLFIFVKNVKILNIRKSFL